MSVFTELTKNEIEESIKISENITDFYHRFGISPNSRDFLRFRDYVSFNNIDISHFKRKVYRNSGKEKTFDEFISTKMRKKISRWYCN